MAEKSIRYSKKREAILSCMQGTKTHPSAEWLFSELKPQYPDLSLGTIYRNLSFFQSQGQIVSVGVVHGQERFDADTSQHGHFICQSCGAVMDLEGVCLEESIKQEVQKAYDCQVSRLEMNVYGKCRDCLDEES